ncbi:MAG TPA: hypothetical protein DIT43_01850 [Dehalococcoidia bacterium]|nr:hypothetical protein [Dehalococcoidia bacterium]
MRNKLFNVAIALMSAGTVGLVISTCFEITTGEPFYCLLIKVSSILFGVGGPVLGIAFAREGRRRKK